MKDRREFLRIAGGALILLGTPLGVAAAKPQALALSRERIETLERESGGRLGVAVWDTGSGRRFGWRDDERFPMCSTFKFLLAAAILRKVDRGEERLERRVAIRKEDLVSHSPTVEKHVGPEGLSVGELCEATMIWSDNAAANLLLPIIGGPPGQTQFLRDTGDAVTRLDRNETSLGSATPGDERDTTSPRAMIGNLERLLLGTDVLSAESRERLTAWLIDNRTGDKRLRAGLPKGWRAGDKTGSGANGTTNDIAIVWPEGRAPILITSYLTQSTFDDDGRNGVLKAVAEEVARAVAA